jgi:hypothetical protein
LNWPITVVDLKSLSPAFVIVAGVFLLAVGIFILVKAHYSKQNEVDLAYLLVDGSLKPPRVTLGKGVGLGAFLASTWVLVLYAVQGLVDAAMFMAYVGGWGAVKAYADVTALKERAMVNRVDDPDK